MSALVGHEPRAGITSFSGRSVKLRRQVEGQHPHNATAEYRSRPTADRLIDPQPLYPLLPSRAFRPSA